MGRMTELIIVGDEAWLPEEWEADEQRRTKDRERKRRLYHSDPAYRQHQLDYARRWREAHRERVAAYNRAWMAAKRRLLGIKPRKASEPVPRIIGSLHSLTCTGPTIATGCVCGKQGIKKIRVYDRPMRKAA